MEPVVGLRAWLVRETEAGPRLYGAGFGRKERWAPYAPIESRHLFLKQGEYVAYDGCGSPCDGIVDPAHPLADLQPRDDMFKTFCGIHAYRRSEVTRAKEHLRAHFSGIIPLSVLQATPVWVVGLVSLWGRIVEHEHGYRAQYAYPRELHYVTSGVDASALAAAYGITFEEDTSWKSVFRFVESSLSPSHFQFPLRQTTLSQPWPRLQLFPSTVQPSSRSLFQPSQVQLNAYHAIKQQTEEEKNKAVSRMMQFIEEEEAKIMLTALYPRKLGVISNIGEEEK
jgi:hypothetical protein